jgi:hypothetical protein
MEGKTVAAGFTLSPALMAYTGANLVMQPQFGMEPIRRPVEEYLKIMYHGSVEEFAGYCERYGVSFVVYDRGMTGPMHPFSSRYIANAEKIKPDSPANIMERLPHSMRCFYPVDPPGKYRNLSLKYRVFQFVKEEDSRFAGVCAVRAKNQIVSEDLNAAKKTVLEGLRRDPASPELLDLYRQLFFRDYRHSL